MAKPGQKISVRCPHCGHEQAEPSVARSTYCRACSEHFTIEQALKAAKAARPPTRVNLALDEVTASTAPTSVPVDAPTLHEASETPRVGGGQPPTTLSHLRLKFGQYFRGPNSLVVRCFDCNGEQEAGAAAQSATCKHCGAYIDLQNYKISGSFSRDIKTAGSLLVLARADLASSKVMCGSATIYGKVRANLYCSGDVTIRYDGKLYGEIEGRHLHVEKGAAVECVRPLRVTSAEIEGRIEANIFCEGPLIVRRTGHLIGKLTAKGFDVEKGGRFDGDLTISTAAEAPSPRSVAVTPAPLPREMLPSPEPA